MDHPALEVPPDVAQGSNLHSQNLFSTGKNSADCVAHQHAENCGTENYPAPDPRITKVWRDVITHPAGASGEVAIVHVYFDWSDGAQTCRCRPDGAWLCVHKGAGWPDALEACDHIELLTGGAE